MTLNIPVRAVACLLSLLALGESGCSPEPDYSDQEQYATEAQQALLREYAAKWLLSNESASLHGMDVSSNMFRTLTTEERTTLMNLLTKALSSMHYAAGPYGSVTNAELSLTCRRILVVGGMTAEDGPVRFVIALVDDAEGPCVIVENPTGNMTLDKNDGSLYGHYKSYDRNLISWLSGL